MFAIDNTEFVLGSSSISNIFAKLLYFIENFFTQEFHAYNKSA